MGFIHSFVHSFVLQGLRLDVAGHPSSSGQGQDGVVDGSHLHSQRDGVLVLAVCCAVVLKTGRGGGKTKDQGQGMEIARGVQNEFSSGGKKKEKK